MVRRIRLSYENYLIDLNICVNGKVYKDPPFNKMPRLNLSEGDKLILVLDPSSKQTGIAVGLESGKLLMAADFKRKACDFQEYKTLLNDYLYRFSRMYPVDMFVYEVPFSMSGDIASEVLYSMEVNLRQYSKFIEGLTKQKMYPILPSVWRKGFLKDKRHDGQRKERVKLKEATRLECSIRHPEYKSYFYETEYVPDSTDSIGIFYGFLDEYWFDYEKKIKRVSKVNSRYSRNHKYESKILTGELEKNLAVAKQLKPDRDVEIFAYNKDFSFVENCEIVTSQTDSICILLALDSVSYDLLKWESDRDLINDRATYTAVAFRSKSIHT